MIRGRYVGVDVGGSKIKGAVVDLDEGRVVGAVEQRATPSSRTPPDMADCVAEIVTTLGHDGPVGIGLPFVVRDGIGRMTANLDPSWVAKDAHALFTESLGGRRVAVLNDADAAGIAEATFGACADRPGTSVVLTFGTGVGSALLRGGRLVPGFELGQVLIPDGSGAAVRAEELASARARERDGLTWQAWADRANRLLDLVAVVTQADLLVIGGGMGEPDRVARWQDLLATTVPDVSVVPAELGNRAGIVGAALHAARLS